MKLSTLSVCIMVFLMPAIAYALPQPDLYPNKHLKEVGPDKARRDSRQCRIVAEEHMEDTELDRKRSERRDLLGRGVRGAALGALGGAIKKDNVGRSMGAGAAVAGAKGLMDRRRESREGSPEYKKYVEACMEDKGYKVVGWR